MNPGTVVDRYVVEERIGEGGMAVVYRVRHQTLGSRHALKVLTITSQDVVDRLVQEGKVQAQLQHPNVVSVSDVLQVNGAPGLVMEYIQGPALDHWLYNYTPTLEEALTVFRGIVAGVGAAHAKGILHRDLKPANILLHVDERGVHPKVTDFGLAKLTHATGQRQTRTGTTMGTPQYMSPEQIRDASTVDRRADLYSLGVILYELVCGEAPYKDGDVIELFAKVAAGDHRHPRDLHATLPQQVVDVIEGLMETNTLHRLSDCASVLEVLDGADSEQFTSTFDLTSSTELPPPRPMPANPGPTSMVPSMPGAAIANRWVAELVSVQPDTAAAGPADDEDSGLQIDLRTPTPPASIPAPASGWGTRALVLALVGLVAALAVALVGTLGLLVTQLDTGPSATTVLEPPVPARPEPPPAPDAPVPDAPTPEPVAAPEPAAPEPTPPRTDPVPVVPTPTTVVPTPVDPPPTPAPAVTPVAEPAVPAPAAATTGTFAMEPNPDVPWIALTTDARTYFPGEPLPAGTYRIRARFADATEKVTAGTATIRPGTTTTLRCVADALACRAR
jgi:serine/threonine-protein kinase